jgi:hypothetical protein
MSFFPVIELVDRYSIAQLKFDKTQANKSELEFYINQLSKFDLSLIKLELDNLYNIHKQIWSLESQLKMGLEHELPMDEIGRRAIAIRDLNNKRITLKNSMAKKLKCNIREIKHDHLSE